LLELVDKRKDYPGNLVHVCQSFVRQHHVDVERGNLVMHTGPLASVAGLNKVLLDQFRQQGVFTFVANAVRDVIQGPASPVLADRWQLRPCDFILLEVLVWYHLQEVAEGCLVVVDLRVKLAQDQTFVLNA
jgi:hypothetical protein